MEQTSSRFKALSLFLLVLAFGLVIAGSYYAGKLGKMIPSASPTPAAEILGTQEENSVSPTTIPTEIPSLADEITPTTTPSPSPTISPTPKTLLINPSLKIKPQEFQIVIPPTSTPTPFPTIKFEQIKPELQIQF